jgi:hypothetical protein
VTELEDLPPLEFVTETGPIEERISEGEIGEALIRFGPIDGDGDRVEVPASSYCSGLCGQWMTLVVESSGSGWAVTGTTGPVAIS